MIFFADENVSPRVVGLLEAFDPNNEVRALAKYFPSGTRDTHWMREISQWSPKPHVICGDGRILRNQAERAALRESDLMFFHLASGWTALRWEDFAWKIIKVWPDIVRNAQTTRKPTVFEVSVNLKVEDKGLIVDLPRSVCEKPQYEPRP